MSLPYSTALERLHSGRTGLIDLVSSLSSKQMARTGSHPLLGEAPIPLWFESLLLHEAHHLYVIMRRVAEATSLQRMGRVPALWFFTTDSDATEICIDIGQGIPHTSCCGDTATQPERLPGKR